MTKTELKKVVKNNTRHELAALDIMDAVEAYSKALIAAKPIVSGSLPPMVEIDFGGNVKAKIELKDDVKVIAAMDGWGNEICLDKVKVTGGNDR